MEEIIRIREIDGPMPYDHYDSVKGEWFHATGREWYDDRYDCWEKEYEGDWTEEYPTTE
jgi:hypothetical protein